MMFCSLIQLTTSNCVIAIPINNTDQCPCKLLHKHTGNKSNHWENNLHAAVQWMHMPYNNTHRDSTNLLDAVLIHCCLTSIVAQSQYLCKHIATQFTYTNQLYQPCNLNYAVQTFSVYLCELCAYVSYVCVCVYACACMRKLTCN